MPEIPDVITSEVVASEWGNDIRDRTVQRYVDLTERTADHSSPVAGDLSYLASTGDVDIYHSAAWRHVSGTPVGTVILNAAANVPIGWLLCNGQAVSRTTYAALFAALSTTWGVGDGSTTFNVPDLRGRFPRGVAASGTGDALGDTFGADTHTHTGPSHVHTGPSHTHNTNITSFSSGSGGLHDHDGTTDGATKPHGGHVFQGTGDDPEGHTHPIQSDGSHTHTVDPPNTTSTASGTANTGASGTAATGSSSTLPASAALHYLIKT